jgi:hypothetical protein
VAKVYNRSRAMAIEVCLSINLVVIFNFNIFPFPPSRAQFLVNVPMNRQNAANCWPPFELLFLPV